jgi:hypothetical protein
MCHADQQWTEAIPLVLLGIRTAFKEDLQASVAELVLTEPLRISGVLLIPTADPIDPAHLITELRQHMARSDQFQQHAKPPQPNSCTATSKNAHTTSSVKTQRPGLWSPLQRPLQGSVAEREDTATLRAREARHCVSRNGRASLHVQWDRPREQQLQPTSRRNPDHSTA